MGGKGSIMRAKREKRTKRAKRELTVSPS